MSEDKPDYKKNFRDCLAFVKELNVNHIDIILDADEECGLKFDIGNDEFIITEKILEMSPDNMEYEMNLLFRPRALRHVIYDNKDVGLYIDVKQKTVDYHPGSKFDIWRIKAAADEHGMKLLDKGTYWNDKDDILAHD